MATSRPPGPSARASGAITRLALNSSGARAIGLRRDHQVIIGLRAARPRNDRVKQETMVFAIEHEDDRALVNRIARAGADGRFPILAQELLETDDLLLELMRRIAGQRQFVPNQARCRVD